MGWISDFLYSSISDTLLPVVRPLLEDVVYEVLNDRQVPSRTDFHEVRDLVNAMRGTVSTAGTTAKKLQARVEALEAQTAEQAQLIASLQRHVYADPAPAAKAPARKTPRKPAPKGSAARKPAARKSAAKKTPSRAKAKKAS